jgi:hypothetical protein
VTVPVAAVGETVAVKTTSEPGYAVVGEAESEVVEVVPDEEEESTVSVIELDVLEAYVESPP